MNNIVYMFINIDVQPKIPKSFLVHVRRLKEK